MSVPHMDIGVAGVKHDAALKFFLGSRAVDVINVYAKSRQSFFVSLHFNAPHYPWEAPGDEAESNRLRSTNLRHLDGGTQKTYQRMIEEMDTIEVIDHDTREIIEKRWPWLLDKILPKKPS